MIWSYQTGDHVYPVAISSDGSYIAAGSYDNKVYLFSRTDNTPLWSYTTGGNVSSVSISSDGSYIAAGSWDEKVYLFSRTDNTPLWSYQTGDIIMSVAISSDGKYIVAGGNCPIYLFSRGSSTPLWSYGPTGSVMSVAISSDGSYLAAGDWIPDNKIYLFSKESSGPLWSYMTGDLVSSVAISSDGSYIAAGSDDGNVYLFSRTSNIPLWSHTDDYWVGPVAITSDGSYIAAGGSGQNIYNIYLFSRTSNIPLWSYGTGAHVYSVAISSGGDYVVAGDYGGKVYLFSRRYSTTLTITPSSFIVLAGESTTLTATLTSGGVPITEKTIVLNANIGSLSPSGATTDSAGQVTVAYTAPDTKGSAIVTASFAGDNEYLEDNGSSSGTILDPTTLVISPSSFTLKPGENEALTATLTSNDIPLENKTITWSVDAGNICALSEITNSSGQVSSTYTAPDLNALATITASFAGDEGYAASGENSSATVFKIVFTFRDLEGNPLANTAIYYGYSSDQVTEYLGTTDSQGNLTSYNSALGGQTVYFKTSDEKYVGSLSIGSSGGEVTVALTEVEFPILWVIAAIALVAATIGIMVFVKKRK